VGLLTGQRIRRDALGGTQVIKERKKTGLLTNLAFIRRNRMYTWRYWVAAYRFIKFKVTHPHIQTSGFFFLGKNVEIYCNKNYGRMRIGRWVHIGDGNAIRCHEGNLTIGDKSVFGRCNTVNAYIDIYFGPKSLVADWCYICDFDHRYADTNVAIKDQGIVKSPVRFEGDIWVGEKCSVLRGVTVGRGSIVASHALVNKDVPPYSIVGGVPARILKSRLPEGGKP